MSVKPSSVLDNIVAAWTTHVERQIEFSKFDDVLDLYKGWIDSNLIGQVKQIKSILGTVMDGIK
jgi:hypothetical protein